jgi:hypothetical protein
MFLEKNEKHLWALFFISNQQYVVLTGKEILKKYAEFDCLSYKMLKGKHSEMIDTSITRYKFSKFTKEGYIRCSIWHYLGSSLLFQERYLNS